MFFLQFLLDDRRIRIWIRKAQNHMDPTDPGPQHWFLNWIHKNDLAHLDLSAKEDGILVHLRDMRREVEVVSIPLTNGSGSRCGSGSCYFRNSPSRRQQKPKLLLFTF
jgi:hypothetical protein